MPWVLWQAILGVPTAHPNTKVRNVRVNSARGGRILEAVKDAPGRAIASYEVSGQAKVRTGRLLGISEDHCRARVDEDMRRKSGDYFASATLFQD